MKKTKADKRYESSRRVKKAKADKRYARTWGREEGVWISRAASAVHREEKKTKKKKQRETSRKKRRRRGMVDKSEILYVDIGLLLGHSRVIHHLWADSSGKVASSEKLCERRFCLSIGAV